MPNTPEQDKMLAWDKAFWLSLDPRLRPLDLNVTNTEANRAILAADLQTQGLHIDLQIMIWGWNPYHVMILRRNYGEDTSPYDPNVLPKPFDPPPPLPPVETRIVGDYQNYLNYYACLPLGLSVPDGAFRVQDSANYKKRVVRGLMGPTHWFEKQ